MSSTRKKILSVTWQLMRKGSGMALRMSDIASAAELSRQALYLHFDSRTELFVDAARYGDEVLKMEDRLQAVQDAPSGIACLNAFISFWGNYLPDIRGCAKALMDIRETDEAAAAAWNDRMNTMREACREIVESLHRDGVLCSGWTIEEATDVLWSMVSIPNWLQLTQECGWSQKEYTNRMQTMAHRVLVCDQ